MLLDFTKRLFLPCTLLALVLPLLFSGGKLRHADGLLTALLSFTQVKLLLLLESLNDTFCEACHD